LKDPYLYHRIDRRSITETNSIDNNLFTLMLNEFFQIVVTVEINIESISSFKISNQVGKQTSTVVFTTNQTVDAWEARATNETVTAENRAGALVGSGTIDRTFDVDHTEVSEGDRTYTIRVYVQVGGVWY